MSDERLPYKKYRTEGQTLDYTLCPK